MKLILPEGFTPPNTAKPGEAFEVVATIKPDDGGFKLVALDGMELPEDEEEEEPEMPDRMDGSMVKLPFGEEESNEYA